MEWASVAEETRGGEPKTKPGWCDYVSFERDAHCFVTPLGKLFTQHEPESDEAEGEPPRVDANSGILIFPANKS